jgi:hypothetical protein
MKKEWYPAPDSIAVVAKSGHNLFNDWWPDLRHVTEAVWTTNKVAFQVERCDLNWAMDDFKTRLGRWDPDFAELLKDYSVPTMTSKAYAEWPHAIEFPLESVFKAYGSCMFNCRTTIDWLLLYAYWVGVKRLDIFGLDGAFKTTDPQRHACTWGWLHALQMRGTAVIVRGDGWYTHFTNPVRAHQRGLYGYDPKPTLLGIDSEPDPELDPKEPGEVMRGETKLLRRLTKLQRGKTEQ